jgi:ubiquitin-protein ligase
VAKTSINSVSSNNDPWALANLLSSCCSYDYSVLVFNVTSSYSNVSYSSNDFYSLDISLPNSYYSRPPYVTVKSIIVVLAANSGEKWGFPSLDVIYSLNFRS